MSNNSENTSSTQHSSSDETPAVVIQRLLTDTPVQEIQFDEITRQFSLFATSATDASQPNLAAAAQTFAQLGELASADAQADSENCDVAENVVSFLNQHLKTVFDCDQDNDPNVTEIVEQANQTWGNYLDAFCEFDSDVVCQ